MQEIAPGIFVETGFRCINVGAILTAEGFVLVDIPPYPAEARCWREALACISDQPILAIINTDGHRDRILGTCWFDNGVIVAHHDTRTQLANLPSAFVDHAITALTANPPERHSFEGVHLRLPSISFTQRMELRYGQHPIHLITMPGPTAGNLWVHLPHERVLFAGDSVITGQHLHIASPTTKPWLEGLTNLRRSRFAADYIVAGRGSICDKQATEPISHYLRTARRRVYSLYHAGRPRSDTSTLISEMLDLFPYEQRELEAIQRRIKTGLERIYDEIKLGEENSNGHRN